MKRDLAIGWALSGLVILFLAMDAGGKLIAPAAMLAALSTRVAISALALISQAALLPASMRQQISASPIATSPIQASAAIRIQAVLVSGVGIEPTTT